MLSVGIEWRVLRAPWRIPTNDGSGPWSGHSTSTSFPKDYVDLNIAFPYFFQMTSLLRMNMNLPLTLFTRKCLPRLPLIEWLPNEHNLCYSQNTEEEKRCLFCECHPYVVLYAPLLVQLRRDKSRMEGHWWASKRGRNWSAKRNTLTSANTPQHKHCALFFPVSPVSTLPLVYSLFSVTPIKEARIYKRHA